MSKTQRIDVEQVRKAIKDTDCRGTAWWRVLVEDILVELVEARWNKCEADRTAQSLGFTNSQGCDEITRLKEWIIHWQNFGCQAHELQKALCGDDPPLRPKAKEKEAMKAPAVPPDLSDWQSSISGDGFRWDAPGVEVEILSGHPGATLVVGRGDKVTSRLSVVVAGRDKIDQARIALRAALLTGLVRGVGVCS